jgi:hypothetical protein
MERKARTTSLEKHD